MRVRVFFFFDDLHILLLFLEGLVVEDLLGGPEVGLDVVCLLEVDGQLAHVNHEAATVSHVDDQTLPNDLQRILHILVPDLSLQNLLEEVLHTGLVSEECGCVASLV